MSAPVISVAEDTSLAEIARLFDEHKIKRVPVLGDGALVGIVSRSDLVRALAAKRARPRASAEASDEAIRTAVLTELESQPWWRPGQSNISVSHGVVHYTGLLDSPDEARAARVAAENVPGVQGVKDHRLDVNDATIGYW
jgi:CBS domain-containing protein